MPGFGGANGETLHGLPDRKGVGRSLVNEHANYSGLEAVGYENLCECRSPGQPLLAIVFQAARGMPLVCRRTALDWDHQASASPRGVFWLAQGKLVPCSVDVSRYAGVV